MTQSRVQGRQETLAGKVITHYAAASVVVLLFYAVSGERPATPLPTPDTYESPSELSAHLDDMQSIESAKSSGGTSGVQSGGSESTDPSRPQPPALQPHGTQPARYSTSAYPLQSGGETNTVTSTPTLPVPLVISDQDKTVQPQVPTAEVSVQATDDEGKLKLHADADIGLRLP